MANHRQPAKGKGAARKLRAAAEKEADGPAGPAAAPRTGAARTIHELQVHRIELEMQNEELRGAQLALEESRDKYQSLYDFAPVGYFTLGRDGHIVEANQAGAAMLGARREQLLRRGLGRSVAREDRDRWAQHVRSTLESHEKQTCELTFLREDGSAFQARVDSVRQEPAPEDGAPRAPAFRATMTDITEQKQLEDTQRFLLQCGSRYAGEDFFQSLASYLAQMLGVDFVCIDRFVGDGLAAQTLAMFVDGTFLDNVEYALKDTPCGQVTGQRVCCFPEGVCRLFPNDKMLRTLKAQSYAGIALWGYAGKPIGLIAVIGRKPLANPRLAESVLGLAALRAAGELERRLAEEARHASEARYRSYIEVTGQLGWTTNPSGEVTEDLPSWRKFTGQTMREIQGWGWSQALHPDDVARTSEIWRKAVDQKKDYETTYRVRRHDGAYRYVLARGVPVFRQDGSIREWVGTCIDITDREEAREALQRTAQELERSNKDLAQFASVASHDLQEPLRQVTGFVELLRSRYQGKLDPKADEYIQYAVDGAARMGKLISDLLAYSRVGAPARDLAVISCQEALDRAIIHLETAIAESGARISHDPLPQLPADSVQMTQLFQNLISNAIKFRREGVTPEIHVGARREGGQWILSIRDNGIGIAADHFDQVFEIFRRLHSRDTYPGTGIGLAICKKIVDRLGGRIWIESTKGEGTTFLLSLPAAGASGA